MVLICDKKYEWGNVKEIKYKIKLAIKQNWRVEGVINFICNFKASHVWLKKHWSVEIIFTVNNNVLSFTFIETEACTWLRWSLNILLMGLF